MSNAPTRFAEMTGDALWSWIGKHPSMVPEECLAALRDAIRAEALEEMRHVNWQGRFEQERTRAERAEQMLEDERNAHALTAQNLIAVEREHGKAETYRVERDQARKALRTAESALGEARREGAREALNKLICHMVACSVPSVGIAIVESFRDREYPATPSGEGERIPDLACPAKAIGDPDCICKPRATPQPEVEMYVRVGTRSVDGQFICKGEWARFDREDARRLLALAQTTTEKL